MNKAYKILLCLLMSCCLLAALPFETSFAATKQNHILYTNQDTGYSVVVDDKAGLFDNENIESKILPAMKGITPYGNVALITISSNDDTASAYAKKIYRKWFDTDSGTLLLIDMANRELYIFSDGAAYKAITKSMAYTITDNVYTYASDGDYTTCAVKTFGQMTDKLEGRKVAAPMRHISALILSLSMGLLLAFVVAKLASVTLIEESSEVLKNIKSRKNVSKPEKILVHRYIHSTLLSDKSNVGSSGSDGSSGGGSSSGGSSSGGSSSGGGGGHSF